MKDVVEYNLFYNKSMRKVGKPVMIRIVEQVNDSGDLKEEMKNIEKFEFIGHCRIEMSHNNADGEPKKRGATTILKIIPLRIPWDGENQVVIKE